MEMMTLCIVFIYKGINVSCRFPLQGPAGSHKINQLQDPVLSVSWHVFAAPLACYKQTPIYHGPSHNTFPSPKTNYSTSAGLPGNVPRMCSYSRGLSYSLLSNAIIRVTELCPGFFAVICVSDSCQKLVGNPLTARFDSAHMWDLAQAISRGCVLRHIPLVPSAQGPAPIRVHPFV